MIFHDFHRFSMIFNNFGRRQYPGSTPAIPRSFGKLRGRVWGPRGEKFPYIYYGSARHLYGLLSISTPQGNKFPYIYYGSGRADLTTGEASFWGPGAQKRPLRRRDLGAKHADFGRLIPILNVRSKNSRSFARFARLTDVNGCAPGPTFHAPDTRMTVVCCRQTPSK